jgi:hypothetical protein
LFINFILLSRIFLLVQLIQEFVFFLLLNLKF